MNHQRAASYWLGALARPALSSAIAIALLIAAFNVSSCHAKAIINAWQAVFINESQTAWGRTLLGWTVGAKCRHAEGIKCDSSGMITAIALNGSNIKGLIPDSISELKALTYL
ncbi:unnamed protein product [Closterium sp. NIES-53]